MKKHLIYQKIYYIRNYCKNKSFKKYVPILNTYKKILLRKYYQNKEISEKHSQKSIKKSNKKKS